MTNSENKSLRRRLWKQIKNALPYGDDSIAAGRASKLFLLAGSLLLILILGKKHPVFSNGVLNLSYHAAAFLGTLLLWVVLAFLLGGALFNVLKKATAMAGSWGCGYYIACCCLCAATSRRTDQRKHHAVAA